LLLCVYCALITFRINLILWKRLLHCQCSRNVIGPNLLRHSALIFRSKPRLIQRTYFVPVVFQSNQRKVLSHSETEPAPVTGYRWRPSHEYCRQMTGFTCLGVEGKVYLYRGNFIVGKCCGVKLMCGFNFKV